MDSNGNVYYYDDNSIMSNIISCFVYGDELEMQNSLHKFERFLKYRKTEGEKNLFIFILTKFMMDDVLVQNIDKIKCLEFITLCVGFEHLDDLAIAAYELKNEKYFSLICDIAIERRHYGSFAQTICKEVHVKCEEHENIFINYLSKKTLDQLLIINKLQKRSIKILKNYFISPTDFTVIIKYNMIYLNMMFNSYSSYKDVLRFIDHTMSEHLVYLCHYSDYYNISDMVCKINKIFLHRKKFKEFIRNVIVEKKATCEKVIDKIRVSYNRDSSISNSNVKYVKSRVVKFTQVPYTNKIKSINKLLIDNYIIENVNHILNTNISVWTYNTGRFNSILQFAELVGNELLIKIILEHIIEKGRLVVQQLITEKTMRTIFHLWKSDFDYYGIGKNRLIFSNYLFNSPFDKNCIKLIIEYLPYYPLEIIPRDPIST